MILTGSLPRPDIDLLPRLFFDVEHLEAAVFEEALEFGGTKSLWVKQEHPEVGRIWWWLGNRHRNPPKNSDLMGRHNTPEPAPILPPSLKQVYPKQRS